MSSADLEEQNPEHFEPVPEDVYGSWSASPAPDGEQVAFISDRSGEPAVWIQGPQAPHLAKLQSELHRVLSVSWSPDGQWLACYTAAAGSSRNEIYVIRPDGSDLHLVAGAEPVRRCSRPGRTTAGRATAGWWSRRPWSWSRRR